ncbi:MAG: nuclear transport factor 2 family protein [Acidobacteria bacterium]|nr:nuclear transport factor 2 family protein [Acidobacteriota bacterium]
MRKLLTCCLAALVLAAAAYVASGVTAAKAPEDAEAQIRATLNSTADGWNRGDLAQYLAAYTESATEMLSDGPRGGVEAIEKTMREGFWKTGRPLQQLRYEHLVVRMLGKENALVTGQYVLTGGGRPDRTGWFTTVWTRTRNGWRMIHDHS